MFGVRVLRALTRGKLAEAFVGLHGALLSHYKRISSYDFTVCCPSANRTTLFVCNLVWTGKRAETDLCALYNSELLTVHRVMFLNFIESATSLLHIWAKERERGEGEREGEAQRTKEIN